MEHKNREINPRLVFPSSRLIAIKYSGRGTALVCNISVVTGCKNLAEGS